jgi:probable F420-dependent oxidoreductase
MPHDTGLQVKVSVQLGQGHADYTTSRNAWIAAEDIGVDAIFNCDHFFTSGDKPDGMFLEAWMSLAGFAEVTKRSQIGVLVSGNSYRNPNLLADMARTVDHISGGRLILGIGSGWAERDYVEYGFEFGTAASRLRDLDRDLPIIRDRLAKLNPGPVNGSLPIMIGGSGEKVTLRLVAEHATIWHCLGDLETLRHKSRVLDEWCSKVGRDPHEIERSANIGADGLTKADDLVTAGFTHLVYNTGGPTFNLDPLPDLVAWRDRKNAG